MAKGPKGERRPADVNQRASYDGFEGAGERTIHGLLTLFP